MYWEIIFVADAHLSEAGWSWGWLSDQMKS
jgi:hypothetical protein